MTALRHLLLLILSALPQLCLFAAQALLLARGEIETILVLARYCGLVGLIFLAFDGQSGLIPTMLRLRHQQTDIRSAYRLYRLGMLAPLATLALVSWFLAPEETASLAPFLIVSLFLRLPLFDGDLDEQNLPHLAMFLQNGWMIALALVAISRGPVDATTAGHAALWSSLAYALCHHVFARPRPRQGAPTSVRPALGELLRLMAAQGLGQFYGRFTLFALGAWFTGTVPALAIFSKQAFNATGLLVSLLRRIELRRPIATMRLSLAGQSVTAVLGAVVLALATIRLDAGTQLFFVLLGWQLLEKLSATAIYADQTHNRHKAAFAALTLVMACGAAGLGCAVVSNTPLPFIWLEALGYAAALTLWLRRNHHAVPLREPTP